MLGALLADWAPGGPLTTADVVGALWLNALRMTIVPLVFAMLVTGAATAAATVAAGGIAARALATFVVLLVASAVFGAVATEVLLAWSPIRPEGMAAIRAGLDAAGALLHYVLVIVAICLMLTLAMYVLAMLARLDVRAFAGAAAAGQAVAFSTQSSLAALPAMVEGAQQHLGVPSRVTGLVLPLAVSLFRYTSPAANLAVVLYLASFCGIEPSAAHIFAAVDENPMICKKTIETGTLGRKKKVCMTAKQWEVQREAARGAMRRIDSGAGAAGPAGTPGSGSGG